MKLVFRIEHHIVFRKDLRIILQKGEDSHTYNFPVTVMYGWNFRQAAF